MSSLDGFEMYILTDLALEAGGPERLWMHRRMMEAKEEETPILRTLDMIVAAEFSFLEPFDSHGLDILVGHANVL